MDRHQQGFTLIELLIVVAIISILAAIAIPNYLEAQVRAKVARARADMRNIATALEVYRIDEDAYPATRSWSRPCCSREGGVHYETLQPSAIYTNGMPVYLLTTPIAYMSSFPSDPFQERAKGVSTPGGGETFKGGFYYYYFWPGGRAHADDMPLLFPPTQWMLISIGPDRFPHMASGGPGTVPEFHWAAYYDSSNGTISPGDVVRIGP